MEVTCTYVANPGTCARGVSDEQDFRTVRLTDPHSGHVRYCISIIAPGDAPGDGSERTDVIN